MKSTLENFFAVEKRGLRAGQLSSTVHLTQPLYFVHQGTAFNREEGGDSMSGLEPVLIAAAIVFVLNAAGSFIEFNNRFVNALVDTVLFAVVFGALVHFGYLHMAFASNAAAAAP
jgi:hypothetical protein